MSADPGYFIALIGETVNRTVPGAQALAVQAHQNEAVKEGASMLFPAIVGAVLGGVFWKRHRWLGALGGLAAGGSLYPLAKGNFGQAAQFLLPAGAGIYGSLKWRGHPIAGYVLPSLGVGAVIGAVRSARSGA